MTGGLNWSVCQVLLLTFKGAILCVNSLSRVVAPPYESGTMNNSCLYVKTTKVHHLHFSPLKAAQDQRGMTSRAYTVTNYSGVAVFHRAFLSSPFPVSFFFHPSVSGNEARIWVRIQAPWQSSARCARLRAGLCHSPWARLMIADGQGINWSSEGAGQSS